MAGNPPLTPQQQASAAVIAAIESCRQALMKYYNANVNAMDNAASFAECIQQLGDLQVQLTVQTIAAGLSAADARTLEGVSQQLEDRLNQIDTNVAKAAQVIAIGNAVLAIAGALVPAIDPVALAAAVQQGQQALQPPATANG
jgi:hypothetical protein